MKHIDIGSKLGEVDFTGMEWTSWPKSAAVDALADIIEKKKDRTGVAAPFILQELEAFRPNWVPQNGEVQKEMDILAWAASYDRYAFAGAGLKQFSYVP